MIRSRHRDEEIAPFEDLEILLFPLSGATSLIYLLLTALFSFLIVITGTLHESGLPIFLFPIWVVSLCGIVKYGFVILEYSARGRRRVPNFSGEMLPVNFDAASLLKEMLLLFILISPVLIFKDIVVQVASIIVVLLILPGVFYYIGVENSFYNAVNPVKLFHFIKLTGLNTVTVKLAVIEIALSTLLFVGVQNMLGAPALNLFLGTCIIIYLILLLFRCIGVLLHSRREELGLPVEYSPEQEELERQSQVDSKRSDVVFDLHRLSQRGNTKPAWEMLEAELIKDNYESEAEYFHAISEWDHPMLLFKMAQGYIDRLLKRNNTNTAWQVFEHCHSRSDGKFQLKSGKSVMDLCQHAYSRDHKKLAVEQLGHFGIDFPKHPRLKDALYLVAQICCADLDDFEQARSHLGTIEKRFPNAPQEERYKTLNDLLVT